MDKTVLIVGYGSIGRRHADILNRIYKIKKIFVFTRQICKKFNVIKNLEEAKLVNPDYILICSNTVDHFKHLLFFEKNFYGKVIFVEKPLFSKFHNIKINPIGDGAWTNSLSNKGYGDLSVMKNTTQEYCELQITSTSTTSKIGRAHV